MKLRQVASIFYRWVVTFFSAASEKYSARRLWLIGAAILIIAAIGLTVAIIEKPRSFSVLFPQLGNPRVDDVTRSRLLKTPPSPKGVPRYSLTGRGTDSTHKSTESVQVGFARANFRNVPNPVFKIIDPYGHDAQVSLSQTTTRTTTNLTITPNSPVGAKPGRYVVEAHDAATDTVLSTQEFVWGVLAFNPDYAVYPTNTAASLAMAVLDDGGKTVCDAAVMLRITDPKGNETDLGTGDGTVRVNEECWRYQFETRPDYEATFTPTIPGTYKIEMTANFNDATRTLDDSFTVDPNSTIYIKRTAPTRSWPGAHYDSVLEVATVKAGNYTVEEKVPNSFEITGSAIGSSNFTTTVDGNVKTLTWVFEAGANSTIQLSYRFQTPNIYPFIFKLGPGEVRSDKVSWTEPREWLIASDLTCTSQNGGVNGNWNTIGNWSCARVPTTADTVVIASAQNITLDINTASVISVTINGSATLSLSSFTLLIGNTAAAGTALTNNGTLTSGTGKVTIGGTTAVSLTAFSGSFTGSNKLNNLLFNAAETTAARTYTGGAAIEVGGNFDITPFGTSGTRAFLYNLGGTNTITGTLTINHGSFASAEVNTVSGTNHALTTGKVILSAASNILTINNSLWTMTGTSGTLFTNTSGTLTAVGATSQVDVTSASGSPTILSAATTFHILKINAGSATVINMGANFTTDNNANNKLWVAAGVLNLEGRTLTIGTSGLWNVDANATLCIGGTTTSTTATCDSGATQTATFTFPTATYTFDAASTIIWLNDANQTIDTTPTYGILNFTPKLATASGTKTYTMEGAATINGNWNVKPNASAASAVLQVSLAGTTTVATTATTTIQPGATNTPTANIKLHPGASDFNISSGFYDLETRGTLDGTSSSSTITATGTSGTLLTINSGTYTRGTTEFIVTSGSGTPKILNSATTFHKLTINAGSATIINDGAAITINNVSGAKLYVQAGVFNAFNAITGPGAGNGTIQITGTLCLGGTDNGTAATCDSGATSTTARTLPTFQTYTIDTSSTVIYLSDADVAVDAKTFYNLKLTPKLTDFRTYTMGGVVSTNGDFTIAPKASSSSLGLTVNMGGDITVAATKTTLIQPDSTNSPTATLATTASSYNLSTGNLTIESNGTLSGTSSTSTITVALNYTNNGNFNAGTTTMTFTATTSGKTLSGTLSGSSGFYKLTFNGAGGEWTPNATVSINNNLTMTAGTLLGTQNVTVSGASATGDGTINLTGGTFTISGTGNFGGATGWTFNSLTVGTGFSGGIVTATGNGSMTIAGVLSLGNNFELRAGAKTWTLSGSSGSPFAALGIGASLTPQTSTFVYSGNNGSGNTTIRSVTYNNLTLNNGSETYVTNATQNVSGDLTITAGTLDVTGSNFALNIGGNYSNSGTFSAQNGTVTFTSTASGKTLSGTLDGSSAFYNLTFNGSGGGWTPGSAMTVTNDLTVTLGTLSGTNDITVSGGDVTGDGVVNLTGGTVTITGTGNLGGATAWTFNNLTIGTTTTAATTSATGSGGITVSSTLTISQKVAGGGNQLNAGTKTWTLSGGSSCPFYTCGSAALAGTTFAAETSTFLYTGNNGGGNVGVANRSFYKLTINNGSETFDLGNGTATTNDLTITAGTLDATTSNYNLSIGGSYSNGGNFTARSATVTFNATATGKTLSGAMTGGSKFNNLIFNGSGGAWSFGSDNADIGGNFTITTGSVTASSGTITITGNYSNSATFTHNSGTVTFNATGAQAINGDTTWFNLSISTSTARSITFEISKTQTIAAGGSTTFQGAAGNLLTLQSSTASTNWNFAIPVGSSRTVDYTAAIDANATNSAVAATNSTCLRTTNWSCGAANSAPDNPTSLTQKKVTGGATLAAGAWTNETQVQFTALATDTDNPDTLQLCVEKDLLATTFSDTEDLCGSGVAYSGSAVTVTVTITGQTDASEYHWHARIKDAASAYSGWVTYGSPFAEADRDYGIDTTACSTATVYDGTATGVDATYNDGSLTSLSGNWDAFNCNVSGLSSYDYSIGTTAGGTDIKGWTNNTTTTSVTATILVLHTNQPYFVNVRATDNAGNLSGVASSNSQAVLPTISFSLSGNSVTFTALDASNNLQDTKTTTLQTSTNAYGGYVVGQYASGLLTSGSKTIPMFAAGSYAAPSSWGSGLCSGTTCGFGYTSNDTTIRGVNLFNNGTLFAPYSTTPSGDVVADHTTAVDGTSGAVTNEQFIVTHKVAVSTLQEALNYQTTIYYIVTGTF